VPFPGYSNRGFTLAELLIALAILGVIATFTIPKIFINQQSQQYNASAKEAAGMISAAFQVYTSRNQLTSSMLVSDLTPYFNYVYLDTGRTIDNKYGSTNLSCNIAGGGCLVMHSGGVVRYNGSALAGTNTTNAFEFIYDPDGVETDGTTNGPGKSVNFFLYSNGLVKTRGTSLANTLAGGTTYASPTPSADPPWFSW
jgi:prepilin-type N-terminal cleavage/methylation domain-containing protein